MSDQVETIHKIGDMYHSHYIEALNEKRFAAAPINIEGEIDTASLKCRHASYDENTNEMHVPIESIYLMDAADYIVFGKSVLDNVMIGAEPGRLNVVIDGFTNMADLATNQCNAIDKYESDANELYAKQGSAPFYRDNF